MATTTAAAFGQGKSGGSSLNPCLLHIQKLGLELKCPLCLEFFERPVLLPCNHVACKSCLPDSAQFPAPCPQCQTFCSLRDLRPAPYIENMVAIYKRMDMTLQSSVLLNASIGAARVPENCVTSAIRESTKEVVTAAKEQGEGKKPFSFGADIPSCGIGNYNSSQGTLRAEEKTGGRTVEIDMNQVDHVSLGSPPISGTRSLDDDSSNHGSDQTPVKHSSTRPVDTVFRNRPGSGSDSGSMQEHVRDSKKQRKLESMPASGIDGSAISKSGLEPGFYSPPSTDTKKSSTNSFCCAFCSISVTTEASGEMMHYINENPAEGDQLANQNVIHVHKRCIEWAPQAYFVGEKIKNLDKELARGAKLKCMSCGLKGAASGCFVKSCRMTYHATCAAEVSGCRWDYDEFLMLCPAHASTKFPNEKLKPRSSKSVSSAPPQKALESRQSKHWQDPLNKAKSWILCGSSLSPQDKILLLKFAKMIGASVSKSWSTEVTHLVADIDEKGACTRTFKVLMAILHGKWVLKIDWIKACVESLCPIEEETYEIGMDGHGSSNGPKLGRLRTLNNEPRLFHELKFYLAGDFVPLFAKDLKNLIIAGGGEIVATKEDLVSSCSASKLVVFNPELPEGIQLGEEVSLCWQRFNEVEELAASAGGKVISHMWILESVASCQLQPFVDLSSQFAH